MRALPALALSMSCLSPQDIELYVDPELVNTPPTFDILKVSPAQATVCVSALDVGTTDEVRFGVDEPRDTTVTAGGRLVARWFIDYESGTAGQNVVGGGELSALGGGLFEPATLLTSDLLTQHLEDNRTYTLEVVISDGFDPNLGTPPRSRATRQVGCLQEADTNPCYAVAQRWSIVWRSASRCEDRPQ